MPVPVTISTGAIPRFLKLIQEAGIPSKVTNTYIKSVGFKSSNDGGLITVFKALGFIDSTGVPTDRWKDYRDGSQSKAVLGQAIKECYDGLFQIHPDAPRKDDEAIANWIKANTNFSAVTVTRAVRTFKALSADAEFDKIPTAGVQAPKSTAPGVATSEVSPEISNLRSSPSVNINIELQLPASTDPKVYENFFAAMKKYLVEDDKS